MKVIKRLIISVSAITLMGIFALFVYANYRAQTNDDSHEGNTTGNIYNGGLFCEVDDKIFFSNHNDDGRLYAMDSNALFVEGVSNDKAAYINADRNYLYYLKANFKDKSKKNQSTLFFFNNSGIYRTKHNGANLKLISNLPGSFVKLKGNTLYYQKYMVEGGIQLYSNTTDGENERHLSFDPIIPGDVLEDRILYSGITDDHNIKMLNLKSLTSETIMAGNTSMPIISGEYMYYISLSDNYSIYRANLDGSNPTLLVKERCLTYNITNDGKFIYYQVDDGKNNRMAYLNLETMKHKTLMTGNHNHIHVTSNFVFFQDFKGSTIYKVLIAKPEKFSIFNPPNLTLLKELESEKID